MSTNFTYPTSTPIYSVNLSGPAFGDSKITPQEVKLHLTMGGTVVSTMRPKTTNTKFLFSFPNITHTEWASFLALVHAANGRQVKIVGPFGTYVGSIANNPVLRTAPNACRYSTTVEVVGSELVTTGPIPLVGSPGYWLMMTGDYVLSMEE